MKIKNTFKTLILITLVHSTMLGLASPITMSKSKNQIEVLPIQELKPKFKMYQSLDTKLQHNLQEEPTIPIQNYVEHEPIDIQDNSSFLGRGFLGDGSKENPYLIEGFNITSVTPNLIRIGPVSVYFVIRNNYLNGLGAANTGIYLHDQGAYGRIVSNVVVNCDNGIYLENTDQTTVSHNLVYNNTVGIYLYWPIYSTISYNTVVNNTSYGLSHFKRMYVKYDRCERNYIIWNDFLGNNLGGSSQVEESNDCTIWTGNHWDDHDNSDLNGDGIADTPYNIDPFYQDPFPLITSAKSPPHLIVPPTLTRVRGWAGMMGWQTIKGTVTVQWLPAHDSWNHSITYAIACSSDGGVTWIPLISGLTRTSYEWNTNLIADSNNTRIQVVATCSDGLAAKDASGRFVIQNTVESSPSGIPGFQGILVLLALPSLFWLRKRKRCW